LGLRAERSGESRLHIIASLRSSRRAGQDELSSMVRIASSMSDNVPARAVSLVTGVAG
jgi:hypothetical protein